MSTARQGEVAAANETACRRMREMWDYASSKRRPSYVAPTVPEGPACVCGNGKIDTCTFTDRGGCVGVHDHPCDPGPIRITSFTEACDGTR